MVVGRHSAPAVGVVAAAVAAVEVVVVEVEAASKVLFSSFSSVVHV